ncbi:MAG: dTDP-4-amino-4,6-dideoxygalactose transaminase [Kiritimatiellae bacterium]|jgi:dTDP-4-amino-4,6-dideoxygalactose transaminase|nr:dTDP-4-amino-4,6-dideoxygalactose transaminase [Kiritimatiellia bacterium]
MNKIPFNKPFIIGKELYNIAQAVFSGHLSGDGQFTKKCHEWIEKKYGANKVLLTHSCTGALEMAAILCNIQPGDEVIMPSYTFVSTANAFVLHGAVPVWCDIREDTKNIDESKIESLITKKTKVIVPVHYASVACEMDVIMDIAQRHNLLVIEDAAQAVNASYKGRYLGTIGHLGCYSFHETKNIISGEGGALVINDQNFERRAEIIREKGTNRSQFFRGQVDKYSWVDIGSSYLPSEVVAAFLYAQLEEGDKINTKRLGIWRNYYNGLKLLEDLGKLKLPFIPLECEHNAHMFYIVLKSEKNRNKLMDYLVEHGVKAVFHYIPLHSSPMGQKIQPNTFNLFVTNKVSGCLLRLPIFYELNGYEQGKIIELIYDFFKVAIKKTDPL